MTFDGISKRVELYILSLWLLFFLIILITADLPLCTGGDCTFIGWRALAGRNVIPLVAFGFVLIGAISYLRFEFVLAGSSKLSAKITSIENKDYEHLTFLTTYIIPLICFNLESNRYVFALVILLIVIGVIYIRTDKYYANPTLAVLGFQLFKVDLQTRTGAKTDCILISRSTLNLDETVRTIRLSESVYYARKGSNADS